VELIFLSLSTQKVGHKAIGWQASSVFGIKSAYRGNDGKRLQDQNTLEPGSDGENGFLQLLPEIKPVLLSHDITSRKGPEDVYVFGTNCP
jgi:hypothetical protein